MIGGTSIGHPWARSSPWIRAALVVAALGGVLCVVRKAEATALPPVAVVGVDGRAHASLRTTIARALKGRARVVPNQTVARRIARLRLDMSSPEGIRALARDMDLALVLRVRVVEHRGRYRQSLAVHALSGELLSRTDLPAPNTPAGRRSVATAVRQSVADALRVAPWPPPRTGQAAGTPTEVPEPALRPQPAAVEETPASAEPHPTPELRREARERRRFSRPSDEEPRAPAEAPEPVVIVLAGPALRTRTITVEMHGSLNRRYDAVRIPGVAGVFRVLPLAFWGGRAVELEVRGVRAVGLHATDGSGVVSRAIEAEATATLGYAFGFGTVSLVPRVGIVYDAFAIETNAVLPSVERLGPIVGAVGRANLANGHLVLSLSADGGYAPSLEPLATKLAEAGTAWQVAGRAAAQVRYRAFALELATGASYWGLRFTPRSGAATAIGGRDLGWFGAALFGWSF